MTHDPLRPKTRYRPEALVPRQSNWATWSREVRDQQRRARRWRWRGALGEALVWAALIALFMSIPYWPVSFHAD